MDTTARYNIQNSVNVYLFFWISCEQPIANNTEKYNKREECVTEYILFFLTVKKKKGIKIKIVFDF